MAAYKSHELYGEGREIKWRLQEKDIATMQDG